MKISLSSSTGCARISFGWKEATLRQTPIATLTHNDSCGADFDDIVADATAWRLPRTQSWDGLAIRGGAGVAGAKGERGGKIARPHCAGARLAHRQRVADCSVSRHAAAACSHSVLRRRGPDRSWNLLPGATSAPAVGPY